MRHTHQALVEQYRGNQGGGHFNHNYHWFDPYSGSKKPRYPRAHGSHTTGTAVGRDANSNNEIGVAPGANWMHCIGFGSANGSATEAGLIACGQFMLAPTTVENTSPNPGMAPVAVNNSWGECLRTYDSWYADVVDAWIAAGIVPVFSAGNNSNCNYASNPPLNTVGNPGRYGKVLGVGSTGKDNGQYAPHSNKGPTDNPVPDDPRYPRARGHADLKPNIASPGVQIRSAGIETDTEYYLSNGTSMSAPAVAGMVALMWEAAPCLIGNYGETGSIIMETARAIPVDTGSPSDGPEFVPNQATGWGEIDALAAVQAAQNFCTATTNNPKIRAYPDSHSLHAKQGITVNTPFTVFNIGGGSLDWTITSTETAGSCANPTPVAWLANATPANGSTAAGSGTQVDVSIDTTGLTVGNHSGVLCIASTDADTPVTEVAVDLEVLDPNLLQFPEPYCEVPVSMTVEAISLVRFVGIDNASAADSTVPHEDFLQVVGNANAGDTLPMRVEGNTDGNYITQVNAFFDWDRNGVLNDPGEMVYIGSIVNSTGLDGKHATADVSIPAGLADGPVRVRVIKRWSTQATDPCATVNYGQAEDYTLQIGSGTGPTDPKIELTPTSVSATVASDGTIQRTLKVANTGAGDLDWSISETTAGNPRPNLSRDDVGSTPIQDNPLRPRPNADCSNPSDLAWVSVSPDSGVTAAGSNDDVTVTFDATGLSAGSYNGVLCADSNDLNNGMVEVPVAMTVAAASGDVVISVDPGSLSSTQAPDEAKTETLTITNNGSQIGSWEIIESTRAVRGPRAELFNNGPFITHPGGGAGGADASRLQVSLGLSTLGTNVSQGNGGFRLADEFEVAGSDWTIDTITFYAYQTGSTTTSTFTGVNLRIWNGPPNDPNSQVVFGDTTTNCLVSTQWTNVYRETDGNPGTLRPIMEVVADIGTTLTPGTYWVDWQLSGTGSSGPWANPVTIWDVAQVPGANALQYTGSTNEWEEATDGGMASTLAYPFLIHGTDGSGGSACVAEDASWLSVAPSSGTVDGNGGTADVTVTFNSAGLASGTYTARVCVQSDDSVGNDEIAVPVRMTVVVAGAPSIEVDPGALNFDLTQGASGSQTFDISNVGGGVLTWEIEEARANGIERDTQAYKALLARVQSRALSWNDSSTSQPISRSAIFGNTIPAPRNDECTGAPGAVIHDDGSIENGYGGNPASVQQLHLVDRFTPSGYPAQVARACVALLTLQGGPSTFDFKVVVFDDDGPNGEPGTLLGEMNATATTIPVYPDTTAAWTSVDLSSLNIEFNDGDVYIGVSFSPPTPPTGNVFVASDESPGQPAGHAGGYFWNNMDNAWVPTGSTWNEYRSLMVRANLPNQGGAPPTGCANPANIPWLSFAPASGSTAAGATSAVTVTANSTTLQPGTYNALLCVNSNDAVNPQLEVPVSMTVTPDTSFPYPYCGEDFPLAVEPITRVLISDIDNRSSATVNGSPPLEDFLSVEGALSAGQSYQIAVEGNTDGNFLNKVRVFFDWNRDGDFADADESFVVGDLQNSTGADGQQAINTIQVPAGIADGPTRMRVIKRYLTDPVDPCAAGGYGQAEDYTVNIGAATGTADLALSAFGLPETVSATGGSVSFAVTIANFGPQAADDVKVDIVLPDALEFVSGRWIDGTPLGRAAWNCSATADGASCELDGGTLPVHGIAAVLQIETAVAAGAQPGTVQSSFTVSSSTIDANTGNNTATVDTQLIREALFCDSFEENDAGCGDGFVPPPPPPPPPPLGSVFESRDDFVAAIEAGFYEEDFSGVSEGPSAPLSFNGNGFSYSVFTQAGAESGLYNAQGVISTDLAVDQIVITFTTPVTAVGGSFWATDVNLEPTSTSITLELSDGTTHTVDVTSADIFRGFTSATPITSLIIDAPEASPNNPPFHWATMTNLIVGTAN